MQNDPITNIADFVDQGWVVSRPGEDKPGWTLMKTSAFVLMFGGLVQIMFTNSKGAICYLAMQYKDFLLARHNW